MGDTNSKRARIGIPGVMLLVLAAITLAGAAASTNFRTEEESSPRGGGEAFSSNFRLSGTFPESAAGPIGVSANFRLSTDLVPDKFEPDDKIPPVITAGPTVIYVGHDRALIEWQTDELADGFVDYGITAAYGATASHAGFLTLHQVMVTGLNAGTTYNFRVQGTDPYLNGPTLSANATFLTLATPDVSGPIVGGVVVTPTSTTSATLDFTTSEIATTDVRHGTTAALGQSAPDAVLRNAHTRTFSGLPAGAQYFYAIDATDPSNNVATGAVDNFLLPANVAFATTALPGAARGKTYNVSIATTGGLGTVNMSVVAGALPAGITLTSGTGDLFGEPTQTGSFTFTVRATDSGTPASTADQVFTLSVGDAKKSSSDDGCMVGAGGLPWAALALLPFWRRRRR